MLRRTVVQPTYFPATFQPRTIAALDRVLAMRNKSALSSSKRMPTPKNLEQIEIKREHVLRELRRVEAGEPAGQFGIRDFLGGVGLIVRRGFNDTITSAGLALLSAKARPAPKPRLAAAA